MRRAFLTLLWCSIGWLSVAAGPAVAEEPENADIRVLIDISGSMKKNDPHNLRRPALRLLVGLLQPGTKAGVWTFAKYAAELVQPGPVTDEWKQQALAASEKINSPGMFTNIELVMQRAIREWEGAKVTHRRNLLLLTDGVVDVSKSRAENAASRKRIIEQLLPQIKAMDAKIHTIALSARADHALLEQLARESGGWYQQTETAEALQRVFLKLFEQAGKPTGVPLKDNKFRVDNTIREATLLLFRAEGSAAPQLTSPSGASFTRETAPDHVNWHQDTGYELITIRDPEAGEWILSADVDPDNRVMVVTDLKLKVSELPARIAVGDVLPVTAFLANDGHLITRRAFLDLVEMRAEALTDVGLVPLPLNDKGQKGDVKPADGRYSLRYVEREAHPEVDLVIAAESSTFLREQRHMLAILEPATLRAVKDDDGVVTAEIMLDKAVIRLDEAKISLWQQTAEGETRQLIPASVGEGIYRAIVKDLTQPAFARVEGISRLGNPIQREYGPVYAPGTAPPAVVATKPVKAEVESKPEPAPEKPAAEPAPETAAETAAEVPSEPPAEEDDTAWVMPTLVFGGVNVLLLIGGLVFWLFRRRKGNDDDLDLMGDEPIDLPTADAPLETDVSADESSTEVAEGAEKN